MRGAGPSSREPFLKPDDGANTNTTTAKGGRTDSSPVASARPRRPATSYRMSLNATAATRKNNWRTSLTIDEQHFLKSIQGAEDADILVEADAKNDATNAQHQQRHTAAQRRLSGSIQARRTSLQEHEQKFLDDLVQISDTEALLQAAQVLEKDPLYQDSGGISSSSQKNDASSPPGDPSRRRLTETTASTDEGNKTSLPVRQEPSFRRELWMEYASQMSIIHEEEKPTQQESKKDNPLAAFFKKAFSGNKHNDFKDTTDESTVTTTTEEIIPFVILGTNVDDPAASPHVLSPPMMDALRPFLPFAIRQDNYWLKYSLLRDVSCVMMKDCA